MKILINLEEGKYYKVICRSLVFKRIKIFYGYLENINLEKKSIYLGREGRGDVGVSWDDILEICEIKDKGKELLKLLNPGRYIKMTNKHELIKQIRNTEKEIEDLGVIGEDVFKFDKFDELKATLSAQKENIKYLIKRIDDDLKWIDDTFGEDFDKKEEFDMLIKQKISQLTKEKTELEDELRRMK